MLARGKTSMVQLAVSPLMRYLAVSSEISGAKLYQKTCVRISAPRNAASTSHRRLEYVRFSEITDYGKI